MISEIKFKELRTNNMTNMKVEIVHLTPALAQRLLDKNTENRRVKSNLVSFIRSQMNSGLWRENGESIIIDKNGIVRDGQHRLIAVIEEGYSYYAVIVTGVNPECFETIDTGKPRGLADIFYINGIKNSTNVATLSKLIYLYDTDYSTPRLKKGKSGGLENTTGIGFRDKGGNRVAGNNEIYSFYESRSEYILRISREAESLYTKQPIKVVSPGSTGLFIHILRGGNDGNCPQIIEFMEEVCGINTESGSAPNFLYRKLLEQKTSRDVRYPSRWIYHVLIRAWNDYQDAVPVRYYKINLKDQLPKVRRDRLIFE